MERFRNRWATGSASSESIAKKPARKRILFVGEAVSVSHVARPVVLAKWAKSAGYDVVFACGKAYSRVARTEGLNPEEIVTISPELFYKRLSRGQFFYTEAELKAYVEAERALIARIKPDLVVGDFRLTLAISTRLAGIPYLNLMNAHWSPGRERRLPPPQSGIWGYMPSVVRNALFRLIEPIAFKQFGKPLDRVRKQYGLPELGDFRKHYTAGTWCGYMDLPGLVEVDTLPRNHHYIGPVIWKPFGMPFPAKSNFQRKLAYVSMGTSGNNGLLPAILKALVSHDFSIALSGVSLREEAKFREMVQGLSDRCVAAPFFDPDEILQSATLTVCHGGSGTVYQSLKAGVPVIAIPSNPDQTLVAEAMQEKGCGILIDPIRATSQRISEAIAELTTGNRHQKGAQALLEAINDWDTQSMWLGLLNNVLPRKEIPATKLAENRLAKPSSNISQALRAVSDGVENVPSSPDVVVRPIRNKNELDEVYRITHDAFLERGYCRPQADGRLVHYPRLDGIPETTVLVAIVQGEIVGTVSFTLDGPAGLHVDGDFREVCDRIRKEGKRMAGLWRIATRSRFRCEKEVVMALFRTCGHLIWDAGVEVSVYTFNPRHERIYQRLFNMTTVATNDGTKGLSNAPAVFMRLDTPNVPVPWRQGYRPGRFFPTTLKNVRMAV